MDSKTVKLNCLTLEELENEPIFKKVECSFNLLSALIVICAFTFCFFFFFFFFVIHFQLFVCGQVGESHRLHFRPGLEGGSSDDEQQTGGRIPDTRTGIEHRRSAEGQVINSPITGKGVFIKYN